jgi:RNA polymerase-interacting CarD/CdnL/TRCF family regulator
MFDIGDVIVYSEHGLCQVDDICEKTIAGVTRSCVFFILVFSHISVLDFLFVNTM